MNLAERLAVVVPSCDKYSDLWEPLIQNFRARWVGCPFRVYLVSNQVEYPTADVTTIKVGEDRTWSANLITALASVPYDYILLLVDDLFLLEDVDKRQITRLFDRCVAEQWDYLRLNPTPGPTRAQSIGGGIGRILPGDWYRSSTVMSIWRRHVLLDVLNPEENAWELEIHGGGRTDKYEKWFACEKWNLPFCNLVIKGKTERFALQKLRSRGLQINSARPIMGPAETVGFLVRRVRSMLMNLVPRGSRRRVRALFAASR